MAAASSLSLGSCNQDERGSGGATIKREPSWAGPKSRPRAARMTVLSTYRVAVAAIGACPAAIETRAGQQQRAARFH